ncbi:MAG: hypothetical protein J6Y98_01300 [Bacteroidales bacterium]|nr:hypothetical protein [Bacteroidales bacterium]MCR5193179.1 hypothetical protein [Bacteroidales bacterium]
MKYRFITLVVLTIGLLVSCADHDDFDFTGTVVDYEMCNGISEMGYAIALSSPDNIGGNYVTRENEEYSNVVVVYGSDRMLKSKAQVSGRIYLSPNYSQTECSYHYTDNDVPEAVFTKLKVH